MWPVCLFISVVAHIAIFLLLGVENGHPAGLPARAFSLIEFSASVREVPLRETDVARADVVPIAGIAGKNSSRDDSNHRDKRGAIPSPEKQLALEQDSPPFYKTTEVSHIAQLQLPLEGVLFSEELALSGRLVLDIAVSDRGKVVNIDVVEATDASGALRAHMLPLLRDAPFSPAYKDGRPVNSVRRVEFTLGIVAGDPSLGFNAAVPPGFRPKLDERGNILKDQSKQ